MCLSSILHISLNNFVSSTKRNTSDITQSGRSLMKMMNNTGYKTDLCSIPQATSCQIDLEPFTCMHCLQALRKCSTHVHIAWLIPYDLILCKSLTWGTLPNAFMKSMYIVSSVPPLPRISVHLSRTVMSCSVVDLPPRKLYCFITEFLFSLVFRV